MQVSVLVTLHWFPGEVCGARHRFFVVYAGDYTQVNKDSNENPSFSKRKDLARHLQIMEFPAKRMKFFSPFDFFSGFMTSLTFLQNDGLFDVLTKDFMEKFVARLQESPRWPQQAFSRLEGAMVKTCARCLQSWETHRDFGRFFGDTRIYKHRVVVSLQ